jgi:hypothetical protein
MRTAVITASYAKDFERCRLLCDSLDQHLKGDWTHYILVERGDVGQFAALSGTRRHIIDEREILPGWLRPFPDPFNLGRRRVWLSPFTPPLRGWHVQQLRRMAMGRMLSEETMFSADSDVVLMRDFDPAALWRDSRLRLFRRDFAITADMQGHVKWSRSSNRLLSGQPDPDPPHHDYINTLIGWRTDTLKALLDHVEEKHGVGWVRAVAGNRAISECTIYGCYTDTVLGGAGHFHSSEALCHVMWNRQPDPAAKQDLSSFIDTMEAHHIGIGIQSFIGYELADIRRLVLP